MPLRVPILSPNYELPLGVKVLEPSLPAYLAHTNVATKADLEDIDGVSITLVNQLITQARADLIAQMQQMVEGVVGRSGYLFTQHDPVTTVDLRHDFDRDGAVAVTIYSLDYSFVWEFFELHRIDRNVVRISFDDPTAFNAIVL